MARQRAEDALRQARDELELRVQERTAEAKAAENKFRALVEQSLVGIYLIQGGRFVYVNPKMSEILGYSVQELTSHPITDFVFKADRAMVTENVRKRLEEGVHQIRYNLRMLRRDESVIHVEVHGARSEYHGKPAILGALLDITESMQLHAKIQKANAELEQRVRERTSELEAANKQLESFSYSVSHDLRAPLRHVQGYVELLSKDRQSQISPKGTRFLETITGASRQMGELIENLLSFARMARTEMHTAVVDLNFLVQDTIRGLEMATKDRNISWKIHALPKVLADPTLLSLVFTNLIGNAVKYSRPRQQAEIEVGCEGDQAGFVTLFVRDNGVGFDMRYSDKLFGVFQRLHRADEFEGTGIGLANVQRILVRHGGRIWADAELNRGATFFFTLKTAACENLATCV